MLKRFPPQRFRARAGLAGGTDAERGGDHGGHLCDVEPGRLAAGDPRAGGEEDAVHRRVVLLSGSSTMLLELFRNAMPVDDVLGFTQRTRNGVLVLKGWSTAVLANVVPSSVRCLMIHDR